MIYFIQAGEGRGPIKIGFTHPPANVWTRMNILQTANAERLYLVAAVPGGLGRERELHDEFADGRLCGEWFRWDTPGLQELIGQAIEDEALQWVGGHRYCTWCKRRLVMPPRTRLCSDECASEKQRSAGRRKHG